MITISMDCFVRLPMAANRIAVCWMLTDGDEISDGRKVEYLNDAHRLRQGDPELFDFLHDAVVKRNLRDVRLVETANIIPSGVYYSETVGSDHASRKAWFDSFLNFVRGSDLVFFDPDNGIEVKSNPRGSKDSCKYIYWDELVATYEAGYSVLVFQHFPRLQRDIFIHQLEAEVRSKTSASMIHSFRTPHVVFFLIARPEPEEKLLPLIKTV